MTRRRKSTAYRKSRKFGDVYGGRVRLRVPGGIFKRAHSLKPPGTHDELPILIEDNPSRKHFFPLSGDETVEALQALKNKYHNGITHVWLRRASEHMILTGKLPLAEFICGSGVRVIIMYPWRKDMRVCFGRRLPKGRVHRDYSKFKVEFIHSRGLWYAKFTEENLRRFCIEYLLYHEVGHHVDWYQRYWGKGNTRQIEEAANQYAVQWSKTATHVFNKLQKDRAG